MAAVLASEVTPAFFKPFFVSQPSMKQGVSSLLVEWKLLEERTPDIKRMVACYRLPDPNNPVDIML